MTVHRFPIHTPWSVGQVNCYLIEDDPLTLLDTGPNTGTAIAELIEAFDTVGRDLRDIERIIVTHQHLDHCGLTALLARHANAEVVAVDLLAPWLEDMEGSLKADDEFAADLMLRHGVPEPAVITLRSVAGNFRAFGAGAVPVANVVRDGGVLEFANRTLEVHHRPGHSPTCTIFRDPADGEVFGGDHLLGHVSSNPLVTRGRPHALVDYVRSMQLTAAMEISRVLPGHGDDVTDVKGLVAKRLEMHEKRARKIAKMLDKGPSSAHGIARIMWGSTSISQAFLTLSEVLGHLDLLIERGEVVVDDSADVVQFAHA